MKIKKITSLILSFALTLLAVSIPVSASDLQPRIPTNPKVITVDKTVSATLQANGCYGNAKFRITGTYVRDYYGESVSEIKLTTKLVSHTADWPVILDGASYSDSGGSVKVIIRYHFNTSYYDCPITGGYKYDAKTVYV